MENNDPAFESSETFQTPVPNQYYFTQGFTPAQRCTVTRIPSLRSHRPCEGAVETALRITPKRHNRPEKHRIQEHILFQNAAAGTKEHVELGLQAVIIDSTSNAPPLQEDLRKEHRLDRLN
jgi:hypothetical protein